MDSHDVVRLATQMDMMQATLDDLDVTVERMDEAIRGNGQMGLVTRVALADNRIENVEAFVGEFKAVRRGLVLAVAAMFGTLFWQMAEWYLGQAP